MRDVSMKTLALFVALAMGSYAQTISGSIAGRVLDPQGASIAGATVTAIEESKNINETTKTEGQGDFTFAALPPGDYVVRAEAPGFKRLEKTQIALHADDKLALGSLILEVGAVTETVEVSGQAATLQTESVERSSTITGKQERTWK